jgi:hypothetical protein
LSPRVHRIKEVFLAKGDFVFPAQTSLQSASRAVEPLALPYPPPELGDTATSGGNALSSSHADSADQTAQAESITFPREDLPPPVITPSGVEIEVDSPPPLNPYETEFGGLTYNFPTAGSMSLSETGVFCASRVPSASPAYYPSTGSI